MFDYIFVGCVGLLIGVFIEGIQVGKKYGTKEMLELKIKETQLKINVLLTEREMEE